MLKHADGKELEMAIRAVAAGETWLSPSVSKKVVAAYSESARGGARIPRVAHRAPGARSCSSSPRGIPRKEIAQRCSSA